MPIAKDSPGDPQGRNDSPDSARSFARALEKLREATLTFERARDGCAGADRARASDDARRSKGPPRDGDIDAIRRALLVEMFRADISRRSVRR